MNIDRLVINMFCPECGKENANDNMFCENCGTRLEEATVSQPVETQQTPPVSGGNPHLPPVQKTTVPATPKKPTPRNLKILVGEILVIIILLVASYKTAEQISSPEKVAENYFVSLVKGDLKATYDYLQLPEDEFLTKENFLKMEDDILDINIANYQVFQRGNSDYLRDYYDDYYGEEQEQGQGITNSVVISYTTGMTSGEDAYIVDLVKTMDKKYLFFDNWVVNPVNNLTRDYGIVVPTGTEVTLDDILLGDKYIEDSYDGYTSYRVPYLFTGEHTIKVSHPVMVEVEEIITTYNESYEQYTLYDMEIKAEVKQELFDKSIEILEFTFENAFNIGGFEQIKSLFGASTQDIDDLEYRYMNFQDRIKDDEGMGLTRIEFTNIEGETYSYSHEDKLFLEVDLNVDTDYASRTKGWFGSGIYNDEGKGSYGDTYIFCYNEGSWELVNVGFASIYY